MILARRVAITGLFNVGQAQSLTHLHVARNKTRCGRRVKGKIMTSAIWGIVAGMALMFGASMYLRQLRLIHRPDRRWTGKKH
jgi:hypothetical protein